MAEVVAACTSRKETQAQVAERLNISTTTIRRILHRENVEEPWAFPTREYRHNWKGGRSVNDKGYVMLFISPGDPCPIARAMRPKNPTARVSEHRLVMARHLGRPLHSGESVHHRNGNRQDNRIENLELRGRHHGFGADIDALVSEAVETLERYAPELLAAQQPLLRSA